MDVNNSIVPAENLLPKVFKVFAKFGAAINKQAKWAMLKQKLQPGFNYVWDVLGKGLVDDEKGKYSTAIYDIAAADWVWIVDPLDGTTNFLHGIPIFAISIALERAGEIVAGRARQDAVVAKGEIELTCRQQASALQRFDDHHDEPPISAISALPVTASLLDQWI